MIERTNLTRDGLAPLLDKVPAYFDFMVIERVFDPVCVKTKVIPSDFRRFNQGNPYQPKLDLPIGR